VGWLGATQVLVATGACGELLDLSAVDLSAGSIVPLVSGVSVAAVRTPVRTPPAPLPGSIAAIVVDRGHRKRLQLMSIERAAGRYETGNDSVIGVAAWAFKTGQIRLVSSASAMKAA
jgi:hypothetical protein